MDQDTVKTQAPRAERMRSLLRARMIFNEGRSTLDCVVRNMSATGARIEISDSIALPEVFDLHIPHKGRKRAARLMWRDNGVIGAEFVDKGEGPAESGDARSIDQLEAENAQLRAAIKTLEKRIAEFEKRNSSY